jgi:hypothetical protein
MTHLIDSINQSISQKNWYSAIAVSLMLPDICSTITYGEKSNGKKYAEWFDKFVGEHYKTNFNEYHIEMTRKYGGNVDGMLKGTNFSGNDCYALRCAYLHEGLGEILNQRAREILDEVKFLEPNYQFNMHGSVVNNKLVLHVDEFCNHIVAGVMNWQQNLDKDQAERLKSFLQIRDIFDFAKDKNH